MTLRLARFEAADAPSAKELFALMARVFDEPYAELGDAYVERLLRRPDFWLIAAFCAGELVGGITAHTLPMTRAESAEVFVYDIAVRADRQRVGIGRQLVAHLRAEAAALGIHDVFVLADQDDAHALDFYRALGGAAARVTMFTFGGEPVGGPRAGAEPRPFDVADRNGT